MILFFDTSALIKRYVKEEGSEKVDKLFERADQIIVSPVTKLEAFSAIKRLLVEKAIDDKAYKKLKREIVKDYEYFTVLPFYDLIEKEAEKMIEKYQLKTLDSISLWDHTKRIDYGICGG